MPDKRIGKAGLRGKSTAAACEPVPQNRVDSQLPFSQGATIIRSMKPVAKKSPVRRPATKKVAVGTKKRSARSALPALADRVIYDSPLKPRHLSRAQIQAIVDEISG
jgi:hypothetical protein